VRALALAALALALAVAPAGAEVVLEPVGTFAQPTHLTAPPGDTARLFVVERAGTIQVLRPGAPPSLFLDLTAEVDTAGEGGLLSLAFAPDYAVSGRLYVYYTDRGADHDIHVREYRVAADSADRADPASGREVLHVPHPTNDNHVGGQLAFGPDGYLYIGVGDGGGSGDPGNDAQQPSKNGLGKIHRIDVNGTGRGPFNRYSIPPTNPLAGGKKANDTVWAWGLRNPWRISFDRATGVFFITDVGQNRYEEINREPAGFGGGRNYGWRVYEGRHCYNASSCSLAGDTFPIAEYRLRRNGNCAITGGYVYRGTDYPVLVGKYVFADFCSGRILTMAANTPKDGEHTQRDTSLNITSFGESEDGELYLVTIDGRLYKVGAS
jgi:glucose/arabinose dehydrogenase